MPAPTTKRRKRTALNWVMLGLAAMIAVVMASPFLLLVLNSFKTGADYSTNGPLAWPTSFTLDAFVSYLNRVNFPRALWNSILSSTIIAFASAALALLASYAIGIGRIRASTTITAILLIATMMPQEALIYPLFYGAQATGLLNSIWSIIAVFIVLWAAYGTYILSSVMSTFPREVLEAAAIDGAGRRRILWSVVYPIVRPTLTVLVVFIFIWSWNEFYIPLILLGDPASQTVPIALSTLRGQHSIDITVVNAGSLLSLIPTLIFFLLFQRTISRGVIAGAVK
ncbi:carbohydrate ABC transporter permease [Actinomyces urogenitalis]|uniref:ABC transporter permease n=2 Tax=Actinomyces TaxID=1654 RepID=A0A2I1KSL2_9ACTO|nr:carbohydrate ABC transporter permease [Actinomyces urogenitalis]MBS5977377.1 carbohydrate ABC transporter permease [Actinomyces urogenitalis]MDU0863592.1 carbohydrate ABC transporter permease [Actinomyces urogenitalis]MDU0874063.1 carbohydrate ABC transporter permease [Actinomyces urogenitalis]MDU1563765.1 carbohydrate ABC transporter permease [Actinomyces urogenitalis]MDU1639132.1 carbohydrate ABC transporter permease [Actinomyces urogenitalis]